MVRLIPLVADVGMVSLSLAWTGSPWGSVPAAVAVLTTAPASASACVITFDAVQVSVAPGASSAGAAGEQSSGDNPVRPVSVICTPLRVSVPELVATKV